MMSQSDSSSDNDILRLKALQSTDPATLHPATDANTIVVKNLQPSTTAQSIVAFFRPCGKVAKVAIPKNQKGASCFAYVEFVGKKEFELALAMNGGVLNGKTVYVFMKKSINRRK